MALPLGPGRVPKMSLPSTEGKNISLEDYKDKKNVVLYFYPEDDTPGCAKVIGKDGLIKKVWENVQIDNHSEEVLNEIKTPRHIQE